MLVTDHETRVVDESYGSKAAAWRDERVGRLHTWKLADPEEDDGVIGEPLQKDLGLKQWQVMAGFLLSCLLVIEADS